MPNLFNEDFVDFLVLLEKHQVDFLLVGGYAVILHGYIRSTGDMDLWVLKTKENYNKLEKVYDDFGAPIFSEYDFINDNYDVWSIGSEPNKIEIITAIKGLIFNESRELCVWFELDKIKIPFIDFDDLIKAKIASGRYKDLADIEQLKKLKDK